jgi:general secretion pathway protein J
MTRRDHGFTLLEVLIALAIVGALLAVAFGGLRVALSAWRQGEDRAEAHQYARGVAMGLARSLAAAYPYTGTRTDAPETVLLFEGRHDSLSFVTQSPPFPFSIPIAFAAVVIDVGAGEHPGLTIRQRALPNWNPFSQAEVVLNDPTVTAVEFTYLTATGEWQDAWDVETEKSLPRGIRLTLRTTQTGTSGSPPPITVPIKVLGSS